MKKKTYSFSIGLKALLITGMLLFTFAFISCENQRETVQQIPVLNFEEFEPYLKKNNDTTYVINFWATWCKPCIEEMPAFLKLDSLYSGQKFKLVLVSLDFPDKLESQVIPYIRENDIESEVVLLHATDANSWINKVDSNWSGAIPVTLVYNKNSREFYERIFTFEELQEIVQSKI
ncbi:MAG: TlpA family protein disulfide reductase [Bacteroidales bacterium]|nr:TlpA family protein disulfide reductase [Bacteroidales bacterium]MCF8399078.1 TlpA family protein disulfide reductase [Bacteroidales bacterium]